MQFAQHGVLGTGQPFNPVLIPNEVTSRTSIFTAENVGSDWLARPDVTKLPSGVVVIVWCEAQAHNDLVNRSWNINFSDDDGATWTDNNVYLDSSAVTGFPLVSNAPDATGIGSLQVISCLNGDLLLISSERVNTGTIGYENGWVTLYLYRSTDNGKTWDSGYDLGAALPGISDPRQAWACYAHTQDTNGNIFIPVSEAETDVDGRTRELVFKSEDYGVTWEFISYFLIYDELDPTPYELGLAWINSNRMIGVTRTSESKRTFMRVSTDSGATWGSIVEITEELGYVGCHQPKLTKYPGFLILAGRDVTRADEAAGADATINRNGYWISTDEGQTWTRRYLDPSYTGLGLTGLDAGDSGYVTFFLKSNRTFLFFGYYGFHSDAVLYKYEVTNGTAPAEDYANNAYFPETFNTGYIRMQMNRDNVSKAISGTPSVGELSIYRVHNTLNVTTYGIVFVSTLGTNNPEFIVADGKGWLYFNSSVINTGNIGNAIFRSSHSGALWLWPDDGQPSTNQRVLYNSASTNPATVTSRFQLLHTTAGKIQIDFTVSSVTVSARTNNVIFADGAVGAPVHVAWTFTSGGLIRIYIDGVLQTLESGFLGDISAMTLTSYSANTPLHVGMRINASSFDFGFIGKMREVIFQPGVYSTTDIDNLMLN